MTPPNDQSRQAENLKLIQTPSPSDSRGRVEQAIEELLKTPRVLQKQVGIRLQHFFSKDTGRLVGTVATRKLPDGSINVAASIVNETQGRMFAENNGGLKFKKTCTCTVAEISVQVLHDRIKPRCGTCGKKYSVVGLKEDAPSKLLGCKHALQRLVEGNRTGLPFTPEDARYLLEKGPNTELMGQLLSPKDVRVVNFYQSDLSAAVRSRKLLKFFPGSQWLPEMRGPKPFDRKPPTKTGFFQKLANLFN